MLNWKIHDEMKPRFGFNKREDNGRYLNEILLSLEIRPGLIHLLLTEHNGQTGEERRAITQTYSPLAGVQSRDPVLAADWLASLQGGLGELLLQTATREEKMISGRQLHWAQPTDKLYSGN